MEPKHLSFPKIAPFSLSIIHHPRVLPLEVNESHCHDQYEIYVHLSGRVNFMVEGRLYPVERGDAIITRPFEYHHCVYQDMESHEHYWILFSGNENEELLSAFLDRPTGVGNRIVPVNRERFLKLFEKMMKAETTLEQYSIFFNILQALSEGDAPQETDLPKELQAALREMNENFTASFRMEDLAKRQFLSISAFERQFKAYLGVTPLKYLKQKRLNFASNLLAAGASVSWAAMESGFSDPSYFISSFKKQFGKTPLQYKKSSSE